MNTTLSQRIAAFASNLSWDEIPETVHEKCKKRVEDCVFARRLFAGHSPYARSDIDLRAFRGSELLSAQDSQQQQTKPQFGDWSTGVGFDFGEIGVCYSASDDRQ